MIELIPKTRMKYVWTGAEIVTSSWRGSVPPLAVSWSGVTIVPPPAV